jgi:site-specific DNA-methyltransferase (adenine-specific)
LWVLFLFGAVWMLELNKIHHGDCLELMKDIPDGSIDMILCDLPYGTTACKWDSIIPFDSLWEAYERVIKDNGAIVLTAGQPFTTALISSNMDLFKYCMIWEKPQGVDPFMAKHRPLNNYEDICIFYKKKPLYNPQFIIDRPYKVIRDKNSRKHELSGAEMRETTTVNDGYRLPNRVLRFEQERGSHPTQKPTALFEYLIKTYTSEGETLLDNCMGSGTTAIASLNAGRSFIGIEKEQKYVDIANKRIKEHTQQLTLI